MLNKKLNKIKQILEWFVFIGLLLMVFVIVSPLIPFKNIPKSYVVLTGSMEPKIKPGSLIITAPFQVKNLAKKDIIVFQSPENPNRTITHRIEDIKTDPKKFITKGDNNNAVDDWQVLPEQILGKYLFAVPFLGNIAGFVRKPLGFILLVVLPGCFIVLKQILSIHNYIKNLESGNFKSWVMLMVLSLSAFLGSKELAFAFYKDVLTVRSLTLSTGDWIKPESEITQLSADQPLGEITKLDDFQIEYKANDTGSSIDYVQLWYSHNLNDWKLFGQANTSPKGEIGFNCPDGDGFYDFQVLAVDKFGNREEKNFEEDIKTIFVDTTQPVVEMFRENNQAVLVGNDDFGSGVFRIKYTINNGEDNLVYGNKADIKDQLSPGVSVVRFQAEDAAGNFSQQGVISYNSN